MDNNKLSIEANQLLNQSKDSESPNLADKERVRTKLLASLALTGTAASATLGASKAASATSAAGSSKAALSGGAIISTAATKITLTQLIIGGALTLGTLGGTGYIVNQQRLHKNRIQYNVAETTESSKEKTLILPPSPLVVPRTVITDDRVDETLNSLSTQADVDHSDTPVDSQTRTTKRMPKENNSKKSSTPQPNAPQNSQLRLHHERALITEAMAALNQNAANAALLSLRQHEKTFPNGTLKQEREALKVIASCQLHPNRRKALAESFLERWPNSPLSRRVKTQCHDNKFE